MTPGVRSKPSILVMGEALVDVVTRGDDVDEHVGGSPANVAFGLGRSAGCSPSPRVATVHEATVSSFQAFTQRS